MGLGDTNSVDIVMKGRPDHPDDGKLLLVIFDGEARDEETRFELLMKKLMAYVQYAAGGQCRDEHGPDAGDVRIMVVCTPTNPPTPAMRQIQQVQPHAQPDKAIPVLFRTYKQDFP